MKKNLILSDEAGWSARLRLLGVRGGGRMTPDDENESPSRSARTTFSLLGNLEELGFLIGLRGAR